MIPPDISCVLDLGWVVYPRARRHRAAAFEGAADAATSDRAKVASWCREYPGCGWYCVTGASGIWALDIDAPRHGNPGGIAAMRTLTDQYGQLPQCPTIRTGGGGYLVVFAYNGEPIIGRSGHPAPGLDPRRGRQTFTLPPTVHHRTGNPYRWMERPQTPPDAPDWLLRLVEPLPVEPSLRPAPTPSPERAIRALSRASAAVCDAAPGGRNDLLNRSAYRVGTFVAAGLLSESWARSELEAAALSAGLSRHEIAATIRSAFRAAQRQPAA